MKRAFVLLALVITAWFLLRLTGAFKARAGQAVPVLEITSSGAATATHGWIWLQDESASVAANEFSGIQAACAEGADTCTFRILPTTLGSSRAVGVITTNDVTISSAYDCAVSTGCNASNAIDSFSLCAASACHIVNSGNDNMDGAYVASGSSGAAYVTINLSGNSSGSYFYVYFAELLSPPGTTASLDVLGTADSPYCYSCTADYQGPNGSLPITATDAIITFVDANPLFGFNAPWGKDFIGSIYAINTRSAPAITFTNTPATYFTFVTLAFKTNAGRFKPPPTPFSQVNLTPDIIVSGVSCSPTCNVQPSNFSSGSGDLIFLQAFSDNSSSSSAVISSASIGGDAMTVPAGSGTCQNTSLYAVSCAYLLSGPSEATYAAVTTGTSGTYNFALYDIHRPSGSWALDAQGSAYNSIPSATPPGVALSLTGKSDAVFQSIMDGAGYMFSSTIDPLPDGTRFLGSGYAGDAPALLMNTTDGRRPIWLLSSRVTSVVTAVAFK